MNFESGLKKNIINPIKVLNSDKVKSIYSNNKFETFSP
jgi:hypothetical protein